MQAPGTALRGRGLLPRRPCCTQRPYLVLFEGPPPGAALAGADGRQALHLPAGSVVRESLRREWPRREASSRPAAAPHGPALPLNPPTLDAPQRPRFPLPSVWGEMRSTFWPPSQPQDSPLTELLSRIETPSSYMPSCTQAAQFWGPELAEGDAA